MYLLPEEHGFTEVYCCHCGKSHTIIKQCGKRYCPYCGHINRWRVRERLHQLFKLMKHRRGYRLKMLTLAKQNCTDLTEGVNDVIASFRRLRQTKFWNSHVVGGLFVVEITGEPGDWHPHLHCFIYSLRIRWDDIRDHWHRASNGGQSVWIANISNDKAIYYVTKYVTKPSTEPEYSQLLDDAMKGRRMFQRFGVFQQIKLPKRLTSKKCEACGHTDWITEYDLRRMTLKAPS